MSEAYDPKKAVKELVNRTTDGPGRKLTFFDQCAAFYALFNRASHREVAEAFGISKIAVSQLAGCLARDPRPRSVVLADGSIVENPDLNKNRSPNRKRRYQNVAREFELLGEEAFAEKYYPEAVHLRMMRVRYQRDEEAGRRARKGPDPTPDGKPDYVDLPDGQPRIFIGWRDSPNPPGPAGWYIFGQYMDMGSQLDTGEQWPFKNQAEARAAVWTRNGYEP